MLPPTTVMNARRSIILWSLPRRGWIPDDSNASERWDRLLEQLQPLDAEFGEHDRQPGDVSAGVREIRDQAGSDGIRNDGHHDRNGGRRALGLLNRRSDVRNDQINFLFNEFGGQLGEPSIVAIGPSPFDAHVAALGVAHVLETLPERLRLFAVG